MNQLSQNIDNRIGALELSDAVAAMNDGALENAAGYIAAVPPTAPGTCMPTKFPMCSRIDDGALEASGEMTMHPRTGWRNPSGECV